MSTDSMAQRLLPHLRRVALARDADTGDAQLLGEFIATNDEASFALLVRRHGSMVLGVCRRVVGDTHLAEDAFQATFLVLARRAATVRPRHLVGHWLYGVAYRTALKARGNAARRKAREKQVDAMPQPAVSPEEIWADLQPVLDAELNRLPDKFRVPVVLCDLAGRTQRDVARELKLPAATLANRLAAARRLLAKRLSSRGIVLSASAVSAAISWHAAMSAVSTSLATTTTKAACAMAAGGTAGLPAPVVELSDGVMRMFVLKKLKAIAATCVMLLAGVGLVADSSLRAGPAETPEARPKSTVATPRAAESEDSIFLRRTSLDLRGVPPTPIEMTYFLADGDSKKRSKVSEWMLAEHGNYKAVEQCNRCHRHPFSAKLDRSVHPRLDHADEHSELIVRPFHEVPKKENVNLFWAGMLPQAHSETSEMKLYRSQIAAIKELIERRREVRQIAKDDGEKTKLDSAIEADMLALKAAELGLLKIQNEQLAAGRHDQTITRLQAYEAAFQAQTKIDERRKQYYRVKLKEPTDIDFLRRVSMDIRGVPPTKVEENYFVADKDPQKNEKLLKMMVSAKGGPREKFIDDLLADPAVQARWVEVWKERIASEREKEKLAGRLRMPADRLTQLLNELLGSKRTDDQVLDALCLATMARFPTDTERKLVFDAAKDQPERANVWTGVLQVLAATSEAKAHAEALTKRGAE